jgi:hypothetical protein
MKIINLIALTCFIGVMLWVALIILVIGINKGIL